MGMINGMNFGAGSKLIIQGETIDGPFLHRLRLAWRLIRGKPIVTSPEVVIMNNLFK